MNIWHEMDEERVNADDFMAVIEVPKGSKSKYELDKTTGLIKLDRVLYSSTQYPLNYGFIPRTYAEDDDPLDVLIICTEVLVPLALVRCYPIGVMSMFDNGKRDDKIIAIPFADPIYNDYKDISQLPKHLAIEIKHFFEVYKQLENKETVVDETQSALQALKIVQKAIDRYKNTFGKKEGRK